MPKILRAISMSRCIGCFTCMNVCASFNHQSHSLEKSSIRVRTTGGLSGKFIGVVCLACKEAACAEVCPTDALIQRKGGGVTLDESKCIGCNRCSDVCIPRAIKFDEETKKPIICKHCGVCAKFCPHGCLTMKEV